MSSGLGRKAGGLGLIRAHIVIGWAYDAVPRVVAEADAAIAAHGTDDAQWRHGPELETLRHCAERLYRPELSGERAGELLNHDYAKPRACTSG